MKKDKVIKHLKGDIKMFKKEALEDKELMKALNKKKAAKKSKKLKKDIKAGKKELKVEKVMHEYKEGKLHSGSKKGPMVKNRKQALAIALSESRKAGSKMPKRKKNK